MLKVMDSFKKMIRMNIIRFREFAYNKKTGEVFGRSFKSWGKCVNVSGCEDVRVVVFQQ